ncbi:MAG: hypothetical protein VX211_02650 [Pseudomonadota bacterium]|nr:hypothetical protein [Pseudomonadota bacterium]
MSKPTTSAEYLKQAYLGEYGGEASFLAWAKYMPEHESSLRLLAEVESATASYLRGYLSGDVTEEEVAARVKFGRDRAADFDPGSWTSLLKAVMPIVEEALIRLRAAENDAPAGLETVYRHFTAHEQALADFFTRELNGEDGTSILKNYLAETAKAMRLPT